MRVHKLLDFDNKRSWFRSRVRQGDGGAEQHRSSYGTLRVTVRRDNVFVDSFHQLRSKTPEELKAKLNIQVRGCSSQ